MINLIKNLWRGHRGGANFERCETLSFQLEQWRLQVTLPKSNVAASDDPIQPNYAFNQEGWFDEHSKQFNQHWFAHIYTELWYYLPAIRSMLPSSELGVHSLAIQLKKLHPEANTDGSKPSGKDRYHYAHYYPDNTFDVYNLNALGDYLCAEYNAFAKRKAHAMILDKMDEIRPTRQPRWPEEDLYEYAVMLLGNSIDPYPQSYEIVTFNNKDWLLFKEQEWVGDDNRFIYPLSQNYALCFRFRHRVDRRDCYKKWKQAALDTEQRIMESVLLTQRAGRRLNRLNSTP